MEKRVSDLHGKVIVEGAGHVAVTVFNAFTKTINIAARNGLKGILVVLVCTLPSRCPRIILTHLSDW